MKGIEKKLERHGFGDRSPMPLLGSSAARLRPQVQSGALAFRRRSNGLEVLVVRKLRSKSWGIPKGNVKRRLTTAENAAKEAFEEAGVKGNVESRIAATYRAVKRKLDQKIVIEVSVHLLEVTQSAKSWPEKSKRELQWCAPEEAGRLLREPALVQLCEQLTGAET